MALSSFQMANVWNRRSHPAGKLLLSQVKLAATRADYAAELLNIGGFHFLILAPN
jgi:hypothetical protein